MSIGSAVSKQKIGPKKYAIAKEKQQNALALRKAGYHYREIAEELGYKTAQGAKYAVEKAIEDTGLNREQAQEMVVIELARLDEIGKKLYESATSPIIDKDGVEHPNHESINAYLKLSERRSRLAGLERMNIAVAGNVNHNHSHRIEVKHDPAEFIEVLGAIFSRIEREGEPAGMGSAADLPRPVPEHSVLPALPKGQS